MSDDGKSTGEPEEKKQGVKFEVVCGIVIALLAAVLALNDLGAGKFGDDELIAYNEKNNGYLWYQTKSIKETLVEEQRNTLQALVAADSIQSEQLATIENLIKKLDSEAKRYAKEKREILEGSAVVGKENWAQEDVKRVLGNIKGAKEWQAKAAALSNAGDWFDLATLLLQIGLVLGSVSLVIQHDRMRNLFFTGMVVLGVVGLAVSGFAYTLALRIG